MRSLLLLFGLLCAVGFTSKAQQLGLRSPSTDLYFIETDTVRVIYAEGQEKEARRIADISHFVAREFPITGTDQLRKISIILQNETDVPNGYVGLAPWRSEFYLSPSPGNFSLGSLPWADLLAIHEWRHVQQRSAARTGLSKAAYYLFGEDFFSGVVNVSWPNWYIEGDAVISETVLTRQGRGRLPGFLNGYRESVVDGKYWSYMKARNGSFKDFIPSHYHLGFLLQNYGREGYGQDFWDKVALEAAAYKGVIYPFSKAVKRVSGLSTPEFYAAAMDHYRRLWSKESPPGQDESVDRRFRDHNYPWVDGDGSVFVIVNAFDRIPAIFKINNGEYEHVVDIGFTTDDMFSLGGDKLCWTEYRWHPRWERVDYSTIIISDKDGKNKRTLSKRRSYFSPVLSSDGRYVAALYDNDQQQYSIHILDAETGAVVQRIKPTVNYYFTNMTWGEENDVLYSAVRDTLGQMAIARIVLEDESIEVLTKWSYRTLGRPIEYDGALYFTRSDAVYDRVCRLANGAMEMLDYPGSSLYDPVVNNNGDVIFTRFTLDGKKLDTLGVDAFVPLKDNPRTYLAFDEGEYNILDKVPAGSYQGYKYDFLKQPVNIHSWRPIFDDPIYQFELQSENVLQSIRWNTGFQWNANNNDLGPYTELTLGMWYPEILFGYTGWTRSAVRQSDNRQFNWYENNLYTGLRIPFRALNGPFIVNGAVSSRLVRSFTNADFLVDPSQTYLSHRLIIQHRQRLAQQHPITRFGQAIDITFPHSIENDTARQFQVKTDFTFPSPFRNHVLWLQFDYRYESSQNNYLFGDNFNYARGYQPFRSDRIYRVGVNYQLPLVYPDWGFAGILYFKRIRANLFGDFSTAELNEVSSNFNSIGAELIFDVELLNVEPFTFGIRWSHLLQDDPNNTGVRNVFGVFVPVNRI